MGLVNAVDETVTKALVLLGGFVVWWGCLLYYMAWFGFYITSGGFLFGDKPHAHVYPIPRNPVAALPWEEPTCTNNMDDEDWNDVSFLDIALFVFGSIVVCVGVAWLFRYLWPLLTGDLEEAPAH